MTFPLENSGMDMFEGVGDGGWARNPIRAGKVRRAWALLGGSIGATRWREVPETRSPHLNLKLRCCIVHGVKLSLKKERRGLGLTGLPF